MRCINKKLSQFLQTINSKLKTIRHEFIINNNTKQKINKECAWQDSNSRPFRS